jgi:hypothetical protein
MLVLDVEEVEVCLQFISCLDRSAI